MVEPANGTTDPPYRKNVEARIPLDEHAEQPLPPLGQSEP